MRELGESFSTPLSSCVMERWFSRKARWASVGGILVPGPSNNLRSGQESTRLVQETPERKTYAVLSPRWSGGYSWKCPPKIDSLGGQRNDYSKETCEGSDSGLDGHVCDPIRRVPPSESTTTTRRSETFPFPVKLDLERFAPNTSKTHPQNRSRRSAS